MLIKRTSITTGITREKDLDVTPEQMMKYETKQGLIQNIFKNLNADDREFIKTGMTPEEWDDIFKDE
jgi:hypothetical protein